MKYKNIIGKKSSKVANPAFTAKSVKSSVSKNSISKLPIHNPPMTEQTAVPPSRVWKKIESILNKQDRLKAAAANAPFNYTITAESAKKQSFMLFKTLGITVMFFLLILPF